MDSPSLHILDVGHGNCCIIIDLKGVTVVDAGHQLRHVEFLRARGINGVDTVVISHADNDHIAGVMSLLTEGFKVNQIYLNPDASKNNKSWLGLRTALAIARKEHGTVVHTELTTTVSKKIRHGALEIEVLAPSPELAAGGPGAGDLKGDKTRTNTMSAVLRILKAGVPIVLLPGDLDGPGLSHLAAEHSDLRAYILVFPHHGGRPGGEDASDFATRLFSMVKPKLVVFSNGRGKYGLPLPEIVKVVCGVSVMCTQLSERCSKHLPSKLVSGGGRSEVSTSHQSCAGTISVDLSGSDISISPSPTIHREFVRSSVPQGLCQSELSVDVLAESLASGA
jgi:competence protein ComEC